VCLKPHPNERRSPSQYTLRLLKLYPNSEILYWLPNDLTNISLFGSKPSLITSIYGSVSAECAYAGIPTLLCGDHPGINFNIAYTAKSKCDYFRILKTPSVALRCINKDHAIYFTAMHFKHSFLDEGDSLRNKFKLNLSDVSSVQSKLASMEAQRYIKTQIEELSYELFGNTSKLLSDKSLFSEEINY
jgi:hypothetical protein